MTRGAIFLLVATGVLFLLATVLWCGSVFGFKRRTTTEQVHSRSGEAYTVTTATISNLWGRPLRAESSTRLNVGGDGAALHEAVPLDPDGRKHGECHQWKLHPNGDQEVGSVWFWHGKLVVGEQGWSRHEERALTEPGLVDNPEQGIPR